GRIVRMAFFEDRERLICGSIGHRLDLRQALKRGFYGKYLVLRRIVLEIDRDVDLILKKAYQTVGHGVGHDKPREHYKAERYDRHRCGRKQAVAPEVLEAVMDNS